MRCVSCSKRSSWACADCWTSMFNSWQSLSFLASSDLSISSADSATCREWLMWASHCSIQTTNLEQERLTSSSLGSLCNRSKFVFAMTVDRKHTQAEDLLRHDSSNLGQEGAMSDLSGCMELAARHHHMLILGFNFPADQFQGRLFGTTGQLQLQLKTCQLTLHTCIHDEVKFS